MRTERIIYSMEKKGCLVPEVHVIHSKENMSDVFLVVAGLIWTGPL